MQQYKEHLKLKTPGNKAGFRYKNLITSVAAFLLVAAIITLVFWQILSTPGFPPGPDVPSHSFTTKFIVDNLIKNGSLPAINPYWYNGFEILHNSPPLVYLPMSLIYFLTKDIFLTAKLSTLLLFLLLGLSTFFVIKRKHGNLNAILGALLYPLAPMVFSEALGSYTRGFALVFYPLALYFIDPLLEEKDKRVRNGAGLAFIVALSLITHPMMAAILILFFSIYLVIRLMLDSALKKFILLYWLFSVVLGMGLVSWYLLPFFGEARGWTTIPEEIYKGSSLLINQQLVFISISLFIFATIAIIFRRSKQRTAIFLTALISMIFVMGRYVPVLPQLPFIKGFYPHVILLITDFFLAYVVATAIDFKAIGEKLLPRFTSGRALVNVGLIIIIAGLPFMESAKLNQIFYKKAEPIPYYDKDITKKLEGYSGSGRAMLMKYPFLYLTWPIAVDAKKPMVEGHYYSATPIGKHIAWAYDALDNGWYNYVFKSLSLWNTRYFVKTEYLNDYPQFLGKLPANGFNLDYKNVRYDLYYKKVPSNYLIPLKQRFLAVGKYSSVASALVDSSVQGGSIYIDDYDLKTLKLFDGIILYGFTFRDKEKAEALVRNYAASGGKVVIDLLGYESPLEENPSFLGVMTYSRTATKAVNLNTEPDEQISQELIPNYFPLPSIYTDLKKTKFKEWRYVTYYDLDKTLARTADNLVNGAIGYKRINGNKVWFLGPNYFYHTFASHNVKQLRFLGMLVGGKEEKQIADYKIYDEQLKPENIKFNYESAGPLPVFASFTYSPHWKAYLNGNPIDITNLEDLIFLDLPEGKGQVEIKYESTPVHFYGKTLTVFTLLLIGLLLYNEKYNNISYRQFTKRRRKTR